MPRAPFIPLLVVLAGCVLPAANVRSDDTVKFTQIFDGKSLQGWKGEAARWRVEGGVIVGEIPAGQRLDHNNSAGRCGLPLGHDPGAGPL